MISSSSQDARQRTETGRNELADYSGLLVQVICCMEHCSLVQYRDRLLVVNTESSIVGNR